jgi:cellulose synthase/poly-beta-1,6-N-acetylglucosamine synthase-like glycosyltransferase
MPQINQLSTDYTVFFYLVKCLFTHFFQINISMIFKTINYPVVFLSYNEENRHINYSRLLEVCPNALHLNGIKGSDKAHKTVAELVENISTHVIIVDADNYVNESLLKQEINLNDDIDLNNVVISFSGKNYVNGNIYGNGGVKVWPVKLLQSMKTHENSNDPNSVDFDLTNYLQLNRWVSDVHIEGSPKQAWRSGFREGIKLSMENGKFVDNIDDINWRNYERLWRWMHIGQDIENGIWAIYGARQAAYIALTKQSYNIGDIRDFDFMDTIFDGQYDSVKNNLIDECNRLGYAISQKTGDTRITNVYDSEQSKEYRNTITSSRRSPETFIKYKYPGDHDVVFISYGETNAEKNFELLKQKYPKAKRVDGVAGIHEAHIDAAKIATTDYFWVVDADSVLVDDFTFEFLVPFYEKPKVRVWRSKNPVNGLIYGYGGVKLLPRFYTLHMKKNKPDMTTSISDLYEPIIKLSNITEFNTNSFSAWRGAFRECVKLASQIIDRQETSETNQRLSIWLTVGADKPYGKDAIAGAKAGKEYGLLNKNNITALKKINDYEWLKSEYDRLH